MEKYSKELIAASTIPIILTILKKGDNYGYQIIRDVQEISDGTLNWKEGSLYPVLAKLEKQHIIRSYTKKANGRNRKYYTLANKGNELLETLKSEWHSINQIFNSIWNDQNNLNWELK